jgi:hypothetical protein
VYHVANDVSRRLVVVQRTFCSLLACLVMLQIQIRANLLLTVRVTGSLFFILAFLLRQNKLGFSSVLFEFNLCVYLI